MLSLNRRQAPFIAVRLEGGLGDHILGMRVLPFVRTKYPSHDIVVFADCAGDKTAMQVVSMSPFVACTLPVSRILTGMESLPRSNLAHLSPESLRLIKNADLIINAHGDLMMVEASMMLGVDLYEIMRTRPTLMVSASDAELAARILAPYTNATFVGINLAKYGGELLKKYQPRVVHLVQRLLSHQNIIILNIFTSAYDFAHWPEPTRTHRRHASLGDAIFHHALCSLSDRIVPCVDFPISIVAALLSRCRYYIGVDNGIKHLAWALRVPLTFLHPDRPATPHILRWMPDVHRMLRFDCTDEQIDGHLAAGLRNENQR